MANNATATKKPRMTVAQLDARTTNLTNVVEAQRETIKELRAQIKTLGKVVEGIGVKVDTADKPLPLNGKPGLVACDATDKCVGHKEARHVELHRRQVAKKKAA